MMVSITGNTSGGSGHILIPAATYATNAGYELQQNSTDKHSASSLESMTWLKKMRKEGAEFGVGSQKIQVFNKTKAYHIKGADNNSLCGIKNKEFFDTTFIDLWLNNKENICKECNQSLLLKSSNKLVKGSYYFLDIQPKWPVSIYIAMLIDIASAVLQAEEIEKNMPEKYSATWHKAIQAYTTLEHYSNDADRKEILPEQVSRIKEKLKTYLQKHPADVLDTEFASIVKHSTEYTQFPLDFINLKNYKKSLEQYPKMSVPEEVIVAIENNLGQIPFKKWNDTSGSFKNEDFRNWVVQEALVEVLEILKKKHEDYLRGLPSPKKWLAESPLYLIKIHQYLIANTPLSTSLYNLEKIHSNSIEGILVPSMLMDTLRKNNEWSKGVEIIGIVEKTDTKEILETALGLELEVDRIKAARLLHN